MESESGREGVRTMTAEEEAQKRNTDCVYFLASPLTCKKGSECEYRHSEGARVNPRDCWYWLNGNCLNPKCSFRHPPLDGIFGAPATSGPAVPSLSQAPVSAPIPAYYSAYNTSKQSVPCYYFQKGNCIKGDKCPFMHGPPAAGKPVPHQVAKVSTTVTETPQTQKTDSWLLKECRQQNVASQLNTHVVGVDKSKMAVHKPVNLPATSAKHVTRAKGAFNNVQSLKGNSEKSDDDHHSFQQNHLSVDSCYVQNRTKGYQLQPSDDQSQNGREADEFLGESSPGFDVLVDNEDDDSDYMHNEEDLGRASAQGERDLNAFDNYEYHHTDDELVAKYGRDRYSGMQEYDWLGQAHDNYEWERRHKGSAERISDRPSLSERRLLQRETKHGDMDSSDLRHRLLKRRRHNGSRSTASPDVLHGERHRRDHYVEERRDGPHDRQQVPREASISTRLQGRIKLPGRSSPHRIDLRTEERDRGPRHGLSPVRPMDFQGRHQGRLRRKPDEEFSLAARSYRGRLIKRDGVESVNFVGPKSLAELKNPKTSERTTGLELDCVKVGKVVKHRESEGTLPFEGPKSLSVILKRKREADSGSGVLSSDEREGEKDAEAQCITSVVEKKHNDYFSEEGEEEGLIHPEVDDLVYHGQTSANGDVLGTVGSRDMGAMNGKELEHYDQKDGDSDYEEMENSKAEEEAYQEVYDEMDDEDDFARKVDVMFS
ncbi:zinc finger CCCH domain-containing protein 32 [Typha angustifolia]|uniref:zinc finger CCCH domain-containing protein 32 n=1 Tax=Typha angustifolia TaxID=59011 RepID=UPI003C2EE117